MCLDTYNICKSIHIHLTKQHVYEHESSKRIMLKVIMSLIVQSLEFDLKIGIEIFFRDIDMSWQHYFTFLK